MITTSAKIGRITYNSKNIPLLAGSQVVKNGSTVIRVADLPGTTFTLKDVNLNTLATGTTTSTTGIIDFNITSTGVYFVENTTKGWTKSIEVKNIGVWVVKGDDILQTYTDAQIHEICQSGLASTMFKPGDIRTIQDETSIFNNYKIFIENIIQTSDGKEQIKWRTLDVYTGATYNINPTYYYLKTSTATSFSSTYSNKGGMKYSAMRQRWQTAGEDAWSQATGIKPDGSSITNGIEFSKLYYTDGGGKTSAIYDYIYSEDTMSALSEFPASQAQYDAWFVKGYFKSVGTITEEVFNSGYYYTYASGIYTPATTYSSSTTYYGFYETIQEDGIFYAGLSSLHQYMVRFDRTGAVGFSNLANTQTYRDYVDLPCVEEMFGYNRESKLINGKTATSANFTNLKGEGEKLEVYNYDLWTLGYEYWTMSAYASSSNNWLYVFSYGYVSNYTVTTACRVRPGFITA